MNKYQEALDHIGEFAYEHNLYDSINTLQELIDKFDKKTSKCGSCIYLDYGNREKNIGRCTNEEKPEITQFSHWKDATVKCCKYHK